MKTFFAGLARWFCRLFRRITQPPPAKPKPRQGLFPPLILQLLDTDEIPMPLPRLLRVAEIAALAVRGESPLDPPYRLAAAWRQFERLFEPHIAPFGPMGRGRVQCAFDHAWRTGKRQHWHIAHIPEA